jgi:Tfp pilus assembly protein PilF
LGEFAKAKRDYERAMEISPDNFTILNNYAWMLATAPDEGVRDGDLAVEMALRVCDLGGWDQSMFLDTLAASFAESGDFESAVEWLTKAIELEPENAEGRKERLERYKNKTPYRTPVEPRGQDSSKVSIRGK